MQLLADFVADVTIVGMELFQFALKSVGVSGGEFPSRSRREEAGPLPGRRPRLVTSSPTIHQPPDDVQHVQRPTAHLDGNILQRFDVTEFFPNFLRWNDNRSSRRESALTFPTFSRRYWSGLTSAATSDDDSNARFGENTVHRFPEPSAGRRATRHRQLDFIRYVRRCARRRRRHPLKNRRARGSQVGCKGVKLPLRQTPDAPTDVWQ